MKILFSINADIKGFLEKDVFPTLYNSTCWLYQHFVDRGHDVSFVCPSEVVDSSGAVFQNEYKMAGNKLAYVKSDIAPEGDVFFMRGFGQDARSVDVTKRFFDAMGQMENRFGFMANSPETAWYSLKSHQKKINAPFIPSPEINNLSDLEELLASGNRIVAKPDSGLMGRGILFLDNADEARKYLGNSDLGEYSFEHGVFGDESRYFFLNGEPILKRILCKPRIFGVQEDLDSYISDIKEDPRELQVAKKVIEDTGAFYGCVDFKGKGLDGSPQVLEYNGSGTGFSSLDSWGASCHDFIENIIKAVEKKVS